MCTTLPISDSLHTSFLGILPTIQNYARKFFSGTRCASKLQDQLAEVAAMAWKWFRNLAEKGKDATKFPIALARYICRAVRRGRRLCPQGRFRDAMNASVQYRHGFTRSKACPIPPASASTICTAMSTANGSSTSLRNGWPTTPSRPCPTRPRFESTSQRGWLR
jgi:hypothetical protein